ncbi:MAG: diaminopimelate decarboxylase [Myxococcaceae bacterium]
MTGFTYQRNALYADEVPVDWIAQAHGTPTYVYSARALRERFLALDAAFGSTPHTVCYSVKANSSLALLKIFAGLGSGFDIVSGGELRRVSKATKDGAKRTVFAGLGKTREEIAFALKAGILLFNVESAEELELLDAVGRELGKAAPFALRVNPDVNPRTHRYIATGLKTSKFGVPFEEAAALYAKSRKLKGVIARGVDCHIGSQLTDGTPMSEALGKVAELYSALKAQGLPLRYLDVGGGLGVQYKDETPPSLEDYASLVKRATAQAGAALLLEPGRSIVGNAGLLLTEVLYRKKTEAKMFVVVDAGMNDLIRPALYEAHHEIRPAKVRAGAVTEVDVVGPVCESSDVLAHARAMVLPKRGEKLALMTAGAYGMSMASTYNSRLRPCEVLVDGGTFRVIRERDSWADLWRGESL